MIAGDTMSALERSVCYRGFAEAFRSPSGGDDILDNQLIPPASINAEAEFLEAFEPAASKTACSLYESANLGRDQISLYEELLRWYDHFGLQRKSKAELPDHISVELEFMHFLAFREHNAKLQGDDTSPLLRAQQEFLGRHLLPLAKAIMENTRIAAPRYKAITSEAFRYLEARHGDHGES